MSKNKYNKYISEKTEETKEMEEVENIVEEEQIQEQVQEQVQESPTIEVIEESPTITKTVEKSTTNDYQKPTETKGFTPVYKVEFALNNYMEAMDVTKIINPSEGARWQYSLLITIKEVLNAPTQEEFNKEWNTILNFFKTNSKVPALTENFIFRFSPEWTGSLTEYKIFQHLVYLIVNTYDPQTRKKNILNINLESMTEGLTQEQKNKLINFYLM